MEKTINEKLEEIKEKIEEILRMKPVFVKKGVKKNDVERIEVIHKTDALMQLFQEEMEKVKIDLLNKQNK